MKAYILQTEARIRWRVAEGDDDLWARVGDYTLIHPAISTESENRFGNLESRRLPFVALTERQEAVFASKSLGFAKLEAEFGGEAEALFQIATDFLLWCRYLSFQYDIPSTPKASAAYLLDIELEVPSFPSKANSNHKAAGFQHHLECCVTQSIAQEAARMVDEGVPVPVHRHLLVDSYAAWQAGEYRQAILFAAMSAESFAASSLESAYQEALAKGEADSMRILDFETAGGDTVRKDPVYEALAARPNFSGLLHERPLYLLGRSLLVEKQEVYRVARMMYNTRNKIVHRGELLDADEERSLSLSRKGARKAIECSAAILNWFGDTATSLPSVEIVEFDFVTWGSLRF